MKHQAIVFGAFIAQLLLVATGCETKQIESLNPNLLKNIQANDQNFINPTPVYKVSVDAAPQESEPVEVKDPDEPATTPWPYGFGGYDQPLPPEPVDLYPDDIYDEEYDGLIVAGVCGDGKRSVTEQCDDGNADNLDGCNILCKFPTCGNGVLEKNEWCDDNNVVNGDGCNKKCEFERCGNASLDTGEQCDDGNLDNGDGCSKACWREVCGNSVVDSGEECDDGNKSNSDGCSQFCQREICGNGVITPNEQCDDGNHLAGDGCSITCTLEVP